MNKIIEKDEILYLDDSNISIDINKKAKVVIYHLIKDKNISVNINLNSEESEVEYYLSIISEESRVCDVNIYHNAKKTIRNIYNHGVNTKDKKLDFHINGYVYKDMEEAICNQENQIINLRNGKSTICPNLYIDCFNCISNHAAYIGKFDKEKVFYLKSRGLNEEKTSRVLMKAFLLPESMDLDKASDYLLQINNI